MLYNLGTVINVKPLEKFEIRSEREGYFVITTGSAMLQLNDQIDMKSMREGEWVSTGVLPPSGHYFLSFRSHDGFKLSYISKSSIKSIDTAIKSKIDEEIIELGKVIKEYISSMDLFKESIGDYVRSSLKQQHHLLLAQYESSHFIQETMNELVSLPTVTQKLIGLSLSDSISNAEITAYIKKNPSLATEVLRVVNSSYHGLRKQSF